MNCLEFRRELAGRPLDLGADAQAHRAACPACAEAALRAQAFEHRMQQALAVPVPQALADRILLRQTTQVRRNARQGWSRLAAGFVMALGMAGIGYLGLRSEDSLAAVSVAHLGHEPFALQRTDLIPQADIVRQFADQGVPLKHTLSGLTYLTRCPLGDRQSLHMVVQGSGGPVTVMYVPGRHHGDADFREGQVVGRHRDIGAGTLVLLAPGDQAFDAIEAMFRAAIEG